MIVAAVCRAIALAVATIVISGLCVPTPAASGWFTSTPPATDLTSAIAALRALPEAGPAIAVNVTPEGHWEFANRTGEMFTAGTPTELMRAPKALLPDAIDGFTSTTLVVSQDSLFAGAAALKDWPSSKALLVALEGDLVPALRVGPTFSLAIRPNVALAVGDRAAFLEALGQLRRPLDPLRIRVLSAAPGGPSVLSAAPQTDSVNATGIDAVDIDRMPQALGSISRQTAILTARIDGNSLAVQPALGPERVIPLAKLTAAANQADVDLVLLDADPPQQPGGRNWLWQRVEITGLDHAKKRATLADFLDQLAIGRGALTVTINPGGNGTIYLTAQPTALSLTTTQRMADWMRQAADTVSGKVTGAVRAGAVHAFLVPMARRHELYWRLAPGLPTQAAVVYLSALVLGLFTLPITRRWWATIWPPENRSEYGSPLGYWLARAISILAFAVAFLPFAALPAFIAHIFTALFPPRSRAQP